MAGENNISNLRSEVDALISRDQPTAAALRLAKLWRAESSPAAAAFVVSRFEKLRGKISLVPFRLAILRSFTVEPAVPLLRAAAFSTGIDLSVHVGDFNAFAQEILDRESSLYRFAPNAVILAVQTADIAPDLWRDYVDMPGEAVEQAMQRVSNSMSQWMSAFRERTQATLIVHNLEQPIRPALGIMDCQIETGLSDAVQRINQDIRRAANKFRGVYVLDYDGLIARHGRIRWHDDRKWLTARLPIAADQLIHISREWSRFLAPLSGKTAKALVVDLDNTLWGGIIGEDGMTGIKLGAEYPGAGYQALQRAMLDLARKGILLAICSKNNPDDAMEVLEKHPGMLLRPKNFAALRISWNDKVQGLREIASELNIGIDSLAFLDDNSFEREQVRAQLPEVTVIDLPEDPLQYAATLRDEPVFERLSLSAEDQQRTTFYSEQRERAHAEQTFQSKEDFYRFLEQEAEIAPVMPATLARVAQLTQKTNQFNVTTRRYGEQQITELAAQPGSHVLSIRVRDRFGDHGLVGVSITRDQDEACEIDTFLLSCRVIGRTVETALLAHLADSAARRGCKQLTGWFLPTKKNAPAREFYQQHGFELAKQNGQGSLWSLDLTQRKIASPEWIKVSMTDGGND
jgi:FkbH-like protein